MRKISRIQLRGLSRSPSDRLTEDGGCAESLNVCLDGGEIAPMVSLKDVTAKANVGSLSKNMDVLFVHKVPSEDIYILKVDERIGRYTNNPFQFQLIVTLEPNEVVKDIASVGNSLILVTDKGMRYLLYKDGKYKYLGNKLPIPAVEFRGKPILCGTSVPMFPAKDSDIYRLDVNKWKEAIEDVKGGKTEADAGDILALQAALWDNITSSLNSSADGIGVERANSFKGPVFVRYAVRLFDGSYIYQSVPILIGAGKKYSFSVKAAARYRFVGADDNTELEETRLDVEFYRYTVDAFLRSWNTEGWEDIVESLDIFVSTPLSFPNNHTSSFAGLSNHSYDDLSTSYDLIFSNGELTDEEAMENELLSKSQFYKVKSFNVDSLKKLKDGYRLFEGEEFPGNDDLMVRDRLPDYEDSFTQLLPASLNTFNNTLIAVSDRKILPTGYEFLNATSIIEGISAQPGEYAMAFYVRGSDELLHKVVGRNADGGYTYSAYQDKQTYGYAYPYGMVFFPDARCEKVEFWQEGRVYSIEMQGHPYLNCSYAYWGLDKKITDLQVINNNVAFERFVADEDRIITDQNKIYQSETSNPLYFPLVRNHSFAYPVVGVATAAESMSEGQFGHFPMYVFTKGGIWVMDTGDDGRFVSSTILSREVCTNKNSITAFKQSVLFVTDKGVMVVSGNQLTDISPNMHGRHYVMEETAKSIIKGIPKFCTLLQEDKEAFVSFIQNAFTAYDYVGERIILINSSKNYQYVYMLASNTWHRLMPGEYTIRYSINSFPNAEVVADRGENERFILDASTDLTTTKDIIPLPGIIATRPFDLGEPDVLKSITDVRLRGQFAKGAVKFILFGSNDGIHFYCVSTLHGKAWKMFRLIILTDLDVTERLSWVDVMYESRFTNRLR